MEDNKLSFGWINCKYLHQQNNGTKFTSLPHSNNKNSTMKMKKKTASTLTAKSLRFANLKFYCLMIFFSWNYYFFWTRHSKQWIMHIKVSGLRITMYARLLLLSFYNFKVGNANFSPASWSRIMNLMSSNAKNGILIWS